MAKLDSGGGDAQCNIQTVVDEESDGLTVGQSDRQVKVLSTTESPAPRVEGQLRAAAHGKLARNVPQVRSPRDAFVGDRM